MMQWMLHCSLTNGWPWKLRHSIKVSVALQEITPFWVVHHHVRSFWNSFSARGLCSHEPSTRRWHLWGIVKPSWYRNYQHNSARFVLLDEGSAITECIKVHLFWFGNPPVHCTLADGPLPQDDLNHDMEIFKCCAMQHQILEEWFGMIFCGVI